MPTWPAWPATGCRSLAETPAELWLAARPVPGLPEHGSPDERQQAWQALLPGLAGCHLLDTTHDGIVRLPAVQGIAAVGQRRRASGVLQVLTRGRTS